MILTHDEIITEVHAGRIGVDPFEESAVGPASLDLRLGDEIRVFSLRAEAMAITQDADYQQVTTKLRLGPQGYTIDPGELVLGLTRECIRLPGDVAGWLGSRSRFARLGLMVHVSAPFIQPGIDNQQVLEIYNAGPNRLTLVPGERICQFIFDRCAGQATYRGAFTAQRQGRW